MFEIQPWSPEEYRAQTRKSSLIVVAIFAVLGMGLSTLAVQLFGTPGGDNLRYNLGGVIAGAIVTAAILRGYLSRQPWMAAAVYGWQLKRSLMSVTNIMHCVEQGVAAGDPQAMRLLRFYHLGLAQMYRLDGNSSALSQMVPEIDRHKAAMEAQGLDTGQACLYPGWVEEVKRAFPVRKK
ncbi:DUF3087 family protein [Azotobacter salinestris]|uniref:DUF3087 family protein n=1 Tax=Azotobacter salinestris TaxID=69964 RepID=UPI001266B933|nr:DUF3087 family protein [Azotobacter salinestris]